MCITILFGTLLGHAGIVPMTAKKAISPLLSKVTLPALIAHGVATANLSFVNWYFVAGNILAKAFIIIVVISSVVYGSNLDRRKALATSGVYCLFTTRTAVWSLGLPIFEPLFFKQFPEWGNLPYVCAPVDNLLIMPLCFTMIYAGSLPAEETLGRAQVINIIKRVMATPLVVRHSFMDRGATHTKHKLHSTITCVLDVLPVPW